MIQILTSQQRSRNRSLLIADYYPPTVWLSADCVERTCIDVFQAARGAGLSMRQRIWHLPQSAFITTNTWHTEQEKSSSRTEKQRGEAWFGTVACLPRAAAHAAVQTHQDTMDKHSTGPMAKHSAVTYRAEQLLHTCGGSISRESGHKIASRCGEAWHGIDAVVSRLLLPCGIEASLF